MANEKKKIELYDLGRVTHRPVSGLDTRSALAPHLRVKKDMYQFIVDNIHHYVNPHMALRIRRHAAKRELPGYSIPQNIFSILTDTLVHAHRERGYVIDVGSILYADTPARLAHVRALGRRVGVLTSASQLFTEFLYTHDTDTGQLRDLVDEFFYGEQIGDKDNAETFGALWDSQEGLIHAVYDDKVSVCEAALGGFKQAGAYDGIGDGPQLYLVGRVGKDGVGKYDNATGEIGERVTALLGQGVRLIRGFDEIKD